MMRLARRPRLAIRRLALRGYCSNGAQWPPDIEAATGLCADGRVRIAPCDSPSKGLGAFAAVSMRPGQV